MSDLLSDCIPWEKSLGGRGYGNAYRDGQVMPANRYVWEEAHGPIPDGLWVLHKCDNRACVNLDHLYLGTAADNARDMVERGRHLQQQRTHCLEGHPLVPHPQRNRRWCPECNKVYQRRYNMKRRAITSNL